MKDIKQALCSDTDTEHLNCPWREETRGQYIATFAMAAVRCHRKGKTIKYPLEQ